MTKHLNKPARRGDIIVWSLAIMSIATDSVLANICFIISAVLLNLLIE